MQAGQVSKVFKTTYITPFLKKRDLDLSATSSYQPLSFLSVVSKLLALLIVHQLIEQLTAAAMLPRLPSAYQRYHSTETVTLNIMNDISFAINRGRSCRTISLLDLSTSVDTVDHDTLLHRLQTSFGIKEVAFAWFRSFPG